MTTIIQAQRDFYRSQKTRSLEARQLALKKLDSAVTRFEERIFASLREDLGKSVAESYVSEVGFVTEEIRFTQKILKSWSRTERVPTPWIQAFARSEIHKEPVGVVLVIGPWNYPFQLLIAPLVGALAAGNCVVLKPSELAPATSRVVVELIRETFPPEWVTVVEGGVEASQSLLAEKWDHIFFTGGTEVGRVIAQAAAKFLTPVTLELGGKSPCIVDGDIDLETTARRIAWGKYFNAGQTCVAPDYLLLPKGMTSALVSKIKDNLIHFYGENPEKSTDYARIINQRHFERLSTLMGDGKVEIGGSRNAESRYLAPTVLSGVSVDRPLMQNEIFGPLLPIVEYHSLDEAIRFVSERPKPLALYFFSRNRTNQEKVLAETSFGGGCINDTLVHLANPHLPFGGVGDSGLGAYHGRYSLETFSHRKPVLRRALWFDPSLRYPPYAKKLEILKKLLG